MMWPVPVVDADAPLREVAATVAESSEKVVLVVSRAGRVLGIVTERILGEVLAAISEEDREPFRRRSATLSHAGKELRPGGPSPATKGADTRVGAA